MSGIQGYNKRLKSTTLRIFYKNRDQFEVVWDGEIEEFVIYRNGLFFQHFSRVRLGNYHFNENTLFNGENVAIQYDEEEDSFVFAGNVTKASFTPGTIDFANLTTALINAAPNSSAVTKGWVIEENGKHLSKAVYDPGGINGDVFDRANHIGSQTASTISDFDGEVSNNSSVLANTAKVSADGSIGTHSDVDISSIVAGQILIYDGENFVPINSEYTSDGSLYIEGNEISSNINTFEERFLWNTGDSNMFTLSIVPTYISSIFINGIKLYLNSQYEILLPSSVKILTSLIDGDVISVQYEHVINEL